MKILYDHQIFSQQSYGGISRYFTELLKQFDINPLIQTKVSIFLTDNKYLDELDFSKQNRFLFSSPVFKRISPLLNDKPYSIFKNILNQQFSKYALVSEDYDVFHPTYYDTYFLNLTKNKPFILTIYDMIHEIYPEQFSHTEKAHQIKKKLAQEAKKIIAISKNTKEDIIKFYDIDDEKIEVIYLASSLQKSRKTSRNDVPNQFFSDPYLLYIGKRGFYKNFNFFISSIAPLLVKNPDMKIYCVGGERISHEEKAFFEHLGMGDKILQVFPDDNSLVKLYQNATALVLPSLYEGFGIPIIEAFECGCPVISSDSSSLPEIGDNAAIYFDPKDSVSILNAINTILTDSDVRKEYIKKGHERAELFSWQKTANLTQQVYESAIE